MTSPSSEPEVINKTEIHSLQGLNLANSNTVREPRQAAYARQAIETARSIMLSPAWLRETAVPPLPPKDKR